MGHPPPPPPPPPPGGGGGGGPRTSPAHQKTGRRGEKRGPPPPGPPPPPPPPPPQGGGEGESSTLIIPAHNEARIIEESIRAVRAALAGGGRPWEILIVDDGSTDGTAERAAAALGDAGRVARLAPNRGKAGAIVAGVQACVTERLVFTDADLSVPPEFFEPAAAKLDAADVVIGSRHLPGPRLGRRRPRARGGGGGRIRVFR